MKRLCSVALALVSASPAFAGLGGAPMTEAANNQARIVKRAMAATSGSVNEVTTTDGTVVREYVSAQGKVYAVTWNGPIMPDLQALFGEHFVTFQQETKAMRPRHGALRITRPDLVIYSGGHMRAFQGRAYLPQLLPAGVNIEELQ